MNIYQNQNFINAPWQMKLFLHYVMEHCAKSGIWEKDHSEYPEKLGIQPKDLRGIQEQLGTDLILDLGNHLLLPFFLLRSYPNGVVKKGTALKEIEKLAPKWWKEQLKQGRYKISDLEDRKEKFKGRVISVMQEYKKEFDAGERKWCPSTEDANNFFKYWTTVADQGSQMKHEFKQFQPWNTKARFGAWMRNKNRG